MKTVPGANMQRPGPGPGVSVRCECGEALTSLPPSVRIVATGGTLREVTCGRCGAVSKIRTVADA